MSIKKGLNLFVCLLLTAWVCPAEVVEEIYAIVNDQIITLTDLRRAEAGMVNNLKRQLQGDELQKALNEVKQNLLQNLIENKLLISLAREKKYEVDQYLETYIDNIKKQNNMSPDDLKRALAAEGTTYEEWKEFTREQILKQQLIRDELGSKIKVDNSEIMEYYKKNQEKFTEPLRLNLQAIFLKKSEKSDPVESDLKKKTVDEAIAKNGFADAGKEHSQLEGVENNTVLGEFKLGELDKNIESEALKLKPGEVSPWIETDSGHYRIQLTKRVEAKLQEYKDVRDQIEEAIREQKQETEMKKYLEQLRKDNYIKIIKEYQ